MLRVGLRQIQLTPAPVGLPADLGAHRISRRRPPVSRRVDEQRADRHRVGDPCAHQKRSSSGDLRRRVGGAGHAPPQPKSTRRVGGTSGLRHADGHEVRLLTAIRRRPATTEVGHHVVGVIEDRERIDRADAEGVIRAAVDAAGAGSVVPGAHGGEDAALRGERVEKGISGGCARVAVADDVRGSVAPPRRPERPVLRDAQRPRERPITAGSAIPGRFAVRLHVDGSRRYAPSNRAARHRSGRRS